MAEKQFEKFLNEEELTYKLFLSIYNNKKLDVTRFDGTITEVLMKAKEHIPESMNVNLLELFTDKYVACTGNELCEIIIYEGKKGGIKFMLEDDDGNKDDYIEINIADIVHDH